MINVKITLITRQVVIGKKSEKSPFRIAMSPGSFPSQESRLSRINAPMIKTTAPNTMRSLPRSGSIRVLTFPMNLVYYE